jgi:predicted nucleic acid-binding protein
MTTTDAETCMVDTNVLVYSTVAGNDWHQEARLWLSALQDAGVQLCLTPQILREYLVVLTRGSVFEKSFSAEQVLAQMRAFLPAFALLDETEAAANRLQDLVGQYKVRGKTVHDANLVAVMLTHGVRRLITFNRGDFERYAEITVESAPNA